MKNRRNKQLITSVVAIGLCIAQMLPSASAFALGPVDTQSSVFQSVIDETNTTISPSVGQKTFTYVSKSDSESVACYETDIDLSSKNASLVVGMPDDGTTFSMQTVRNQADAAEKNGKQVVAAVNGDFYNMATGEPSSLIIKDGTELHACNGSGGFFGIKKDGTAVIGNVDTYNQIKGDLQEAMSSNQLLVVNSKIVGGSTDLEPRTAVGIRADGSVFFIVIDGRQAPYSEGITLTDLAQLMIDDGAVQAANLDGGGSATFASRTPGDSDLTVKNSPSDGTERVVANSWLVVSNVAPDGQFASAAVTPGDQTYTPGATVQFAAKGLDASGAPTTLPDGLTWSLSDSSYGTVDQTGKFISNGKTGQFQVQVSQNGSKVGSAWEEIAVPDSLEFLQPQLSLKFNTQQDLGLMARYHGRAVTLHAGDIKWTYDSAMGTMDDSNVLHTGGVSASGQVTAQFTGTDLTASIQLQVGQLPVVLYDFENGISDWATSTANRGEVSQIALSTYPNDLVRFGSNALRINYDFTNAQKGTTLGAYAGPSESVDIPGAPTGIGMWVYATPEAQGYWLRMYIYDASGTAKPINITDQVPGINWTGWKYIEAPIPSTYQGPFKSFPKQMIRIMSVKSGLDGGGPMTKGSLYVDNIRAVYGTNVDDLTSPVIDSVNVDGKTYTSPSVNITAAIHDVNDANATGINWNRNRIWVDGVEYTNVPEHFSYDKDGTFTLSGYKWADGTHHVHISIQDNFGNETTKDCYFTVKTGNNTGLSFVPQGAGAALGGTYQFALNADDLSNVTGAAVTVNIGKGYPVTGVDFAASATGSTYQYDASTGDLTLNIKNSGAAQDAGTLATVNVSVPAGTAQGSSIPYSVTGGTATFAASQSDSFVSTFSGVPGTIPVSADLKVNLGQMIVGADGQLTVTTSDGKPAGNADVTFTPAGGAAQVLGQTDANGSLSSSLLTQTAQKFTLFAQLGASCSFQTAGQSFNPQKGAVPGNILAGATQNPATEKTFTWMTNPLQGENKAIMQIALQSDYEKNGESAFKDYTGTRQLVTYSSDSSAVTLSSVTATGLTEDTTYAYRLGDGTNWSDVRTFTTLKPDDANLTFNVFGDTQVTDASGLNDFSNFLTQIENASPKSDFSIHVGDLTDDQTVFDEMNITADMFSSHPIFDSLDAIHVLGNHEYMGDDGTKSAGILGMPDTNGPACDKTGTYSVDYGNMHIAVLGWTDSVDEMNQKMSWLRQDMKATKKTWKIIALHQPAFNKNPADSSTLIYDMLPQVCDELGIDLVFSGHDHSYGRTYPIYNKTAVTSDPTNCSNGTVYISAGHTGDKTYDINPVYPDAFATYQQEANKDDKVYLTCTVDNNKMHIVLTDSENGKTTDDVTLTAHQADKTALQSTIPSAQSLYDTAVAGDHEGNYPQSAIDTLKTALDSANTVNSDSNATPEEVDAAVTALNNAVTAFQGEAVNVDRTNLNTLASNAAKLDSTKYTPDSWTPFSNALTAAQSVLAGHPSQQEINDAFATLLTAESELTLATTGNDTPSSGTSKSALQILYDNSKNKTNDNYTTATWDAFQQTLSNAQSVLANADATQSQVDGAKSDLETALNNLEANSSQAVEVTQSETGVKISAPANVLPQNVVLHVDVLSQGSGLQLAQEALDGVSSKLKVMQIYLTSGEDTVEPDGTVTVSIPIPDDFDKTRLAVYYIAPDGSKTQLPMQVVGNYAVFQTTHFSTYALVETATSTSSDTSEDNSQQSGNESPKTGDTSSPVLLIMGACAALGALVYLGRKRFMHKA